jgi:outer membrane protein assembly factor BamB
MVARSPVGSALTAVAVAALLCVGIAPRVFASRGASLSLSRGGGPPGVRIMVFGSGFGAGEAVDLALDGALFRTVLAAGNGSFSVGITIPRSSLPGFHILVATGRESGLQAEADILVRTDWPQFGFDAEHRGSNRFENVLNPLNVPGLQLAWRASTGNGTDGSVSVVDGFVFLGAIDGKLLAFDTSGILHWTAQTRGVIEGTPAVSKGLAYIGVTQPTGPTLYAFDDDNGDPLWTATTPRGIVGSPTVSQGRVYVSTEYPDNSVYAFDARLGTQLWKAHTVEGTPGTPAVASGTVFAATGSGYPDNALYALDAHTGLVKWTKTITGYLSEPSTSSGEVFVASEAASITNLLSFDAATGEPRWTSEPLATNSASTPAVSGGVVFVGSYSGQGLDNLHAFDASTGALLWAAKMGGRGNMPAVAVGVVFEGAGDDYLRAFDAGTGVLLFETWLGSCTGTDCLYTSPAVADGVVYVTDYWADQLDAFTLPTTG